MHVFASTQCGTVYVCVWVSVFLHIVWGSHLLPADKNKVVFAKMLHHLGLSSGRQEGKLMCLFKLGGHHHEALVLGCRGTREGHCGMGIAARGNVSGYPS